jgi:hypothetical protein
MTASIAKCIYTLAMVLEVGIAYLLEEEHLKKLALFMKTQCSCQQSVTTTK